MKVLILKTGHSETLDREISKRPSLGDILRSTVILPLFYHQHVTWVTDQSAVPLVNGLVDRVLVWDFETALQLLFEKYDMIINLEKSPAACALTSKMDSWQKFGFRFDDLAGEARPFRESLEAWGDCIEPVEKTHRIPWQATLYQMLGAEWTGQKYQLAMKPQREMIRGQIGFNHRVGSKFPGKEWPYFGNLDFDNGYRISWQEGENLQDYLNWLNSCEVIVTNDSLGLHLAIALERKFVALFGPTNADEVFDYGLGKKIISKDGKMTSISIESVRKEVEKLLNGRRDRVY